MSINGTELNEMHGTSKSPATIGPSVSIKGEITGEEDVIIHGVVEGTVNLKKNVVVVAKSGRVQAHIYGQVIHIEGEVTGNLFGTDQIILHKSGNVRGNCSAPRITIEDGARLKGSVDTDPKSESASMLKDAEVVKAGNSETVITDNLINQNGSRRQAAANPARV